MQMNKRRVKMSKTIDSILDEYSVKQGWNLPTQFVLLMRFLHEKKMHDELDGFLKKIAEDENVMSQSM